jgi:hypothetical protein
MGPLGASPEYDTHAASLERMLQATGGYYVMLRPPAIIGYSITAGCITAVAQVTVVFATHCQCTLEALIHTSRVACER